MGLSGKTAVRGLAFGFLLRLRLLLLLALATEDDDDVVEIELLGNQIRRRLQPLAAGVDGGGAAEVAVAQPAGEVGELEAATLAGQVALEAVRRRRRNRHAGQGEVGEVLPLDGNLDVQPFHRLRLADGPLDAGGERSAGDVDVHGVGLPLAAQRLQRPGLDVEVERVALVRPLAFHPHTLGFCGAGQLAQRQPHVVAALPVLVVEVGVLNGQVAEDRHIAPFGRLRGLFLRTPRKLPVALAALVLGQPHLGRIHVQGIDDDVAA
jgi:hypothetical protein